MKKGKSVKTTKTRSVMSVSAARRKLVKASVSQSITSTKSRSSSFRITHRENVTSVDGQMSYIFPVSAVDDTTFPWLSNLAPYFDLFRIHRISFDYVPSVPSTTAGSIILVYDPNCTDTNLTTYNQLLNHNYRSVGPVWNPLGLSIPLEQLKKPVWDRYTNVSATSDSHFSTCGQVVVSSDGAPASVLGYLEITYDVELISPQPVPPPSSVPSGIQFSFPLPKLEEAVASIGNLFSLAQIEGLSTLLPEWFEVSPCAVESQALDNTWFKQVALGFKAPGTYLIDLQEPRWVDIANIFDIENMQHSVIPTLVTSGLEVLGMRSSVLGLGHDQPLLNIQDTHGGPAILKQGSWLQLLVKVTSQLSPTWSLSRIVEDIGTWAFRYLDSVTPKLPSIGISLCDMYEGCQSGASGTVHGTPNSSWMWPILAISLANKIDIDPMSLRKGGFYPLSDVVRIVKSNARSTSKRYGRSGNSVTTTTTTTTPSAKR